jgi:hypothetical protein
MAVRFAVNAAETFGGTFIDPARKCGNIERMEAEERREP